MGGDRSYDHMVPYGCLTDENLFTRDSGLSHGLHEHATNDGLRWQGPHGRDPRTVRLVRSTRTSSLLMTLLIIWTLSIGMPCKKLRFLVFMGFYTVFLPPC